MGGGCTDYVILTLAQVGGERSASRPGRLITGERSPDTHGIGGWKGPMADLDDVEKSTFWTSRDSNSDPSVFQPTASCNSDCTILTLHPSKRKGQIVSWLQAHGSLETNIPTLDVNPDSVVH
jgi:hypothetical protein